MPQISKALLSDAMYCTSKYLFKIMHEELFTPNQNMTSDQQEWYTKEIKHAEDTLNQLRALYEEPSGPRPPIGIDPNFKE